MTYDVEVRFNSRLRGSGQIWAGRIDCEGPIEAIEAAVVAATRDPQHGHSIYVAGATVEQTRAAAK